MWDEAAAIVEIERRSLECLPRRNWGWLAARGALLILFGVLALLAPWAALFAFVTLFAAFSFVDGVFGVVSGLRGARAGAERWWALVLSGAVGIAIGVLFVLFPVLSTVAYSLTTALLIAAWAVVSGIFQVSAAVRLRKVIEGEWLLATVGVLAILLGLSIVVMAALEPAITVLSLAWVIAAYALIAGVALVFLALRLRKAQQAAR